MEINHLISSSKPFLEWVVDWYNNLPRISLEQVITHPDQAAVLAIDVLNGFCYKGPLSSDRAANQVPSIVALLEAAHARGVRHFILPQEDHPADAIEFQYYGPHCIAGTTEAETVPELAELSFSDLFEIVGKNSVDPFKATELETWLGAHPEVHTFIVTGFCTDICAYLLALGLRMRANALQIQDVNVVVPADCLQTYHLPVQIAQQVGAVPHDGNLLHLIFLYSMMLNGVQVVAGIDG